MEMRERGEKSRGRKGGDNNKVEEGKNWRKKRRGKKERRSILTSGSPLPGVWARTHSVNKRHKPLLAFPRRVRERGRSLHLAG